MKSYEIKASDNKNYLNYEYDEKSFKLLDNQTALRKELKDEMNIIANDYKLDINDIIKEEDEKRKKG